MNINRPLMPRFLKRAEQKLLLNKPLIWSTRVHLVLYYGILFNLLLAGLCFVAPMEIMGRSEATYWVGFVIIIAIIALTVWLIYLLRFNVFKKFGNIKPLHALVTFLLYFVSTGMIVSSVFVYPAVECARANMSIGDKELTQDINNMNIKIFQLEHKVLNRGWMYDTVAVVKKLPARGSNPWHEANGVNYSDTEAVAPITSGVHAFVILDTSAFNERLARADSVVKLNDTLYLLYRTPELRFVSSYKLEEYYNEKVMSSFEIYKQAYKQPLTAATLPAIAAELDQLKAKYNKPDFTHMEQIEPNDAPYDVVTKKFNFSERDLGVNVRLFYYFTLVISLLVFIFRHTTVRTFFLSLLTGVLLSIFMAMVLSFSHARGAAFTGWMIGYTLLFFVGSIFTFSLTKRSIVNGILINLFTFIIPVLPLLMVDFFYELNKEQYYQKYGTYYGPDIAQYFLYAEIGGTILFLVLLATYINRVYRRWYSLPEH